MAHDAEGCGCCGCVAGIIGLAAVIATAIICFKGLGWLWKINV